MEILDNREQSSMISPVLFFMHPRYVWAVTSDGLSSRMKIFGLTAQHTGLKELGTLELPGGSEGSGAKCIQYVPGLHGGVPTVDQEPLRGDLVWVGTDHKRYLWHILVS